MGGWMAHSITYLLLELLIRVVNAQLLEGVVEKTLEPEDIEDAHRAPAPSSSSSSSSSSS